MAPIHQLVLHWSPGLSLTATGSALLSEPGNKPCRCGQQGPSPVLPADLLSSATRWKLELQCPCRQQAQRSLQQGRSSRCTSGGTRSRLGGAFAPHSSNSAGPWASWDQHIKLRPSRWDHELTESTFFVPGTAMKHLEHPKLLRRHIASISGVKTLSNDAARPAG